MKLSHSISHATHSGRTSSNVLAHAPHHPRREQSLKIPRLESLSERRRGFYPVSLEVTEDHIARMTYFFNEAPMCDCTTQNAIALAIRPLVEDRHRVSISLKKGEAVAQVGAHAFWAKRLAIGWKKPLQERRSRPSGRPFGCLSVACCARRPCCRYSKHHSFRLHNHNR